MSEFYITFMSGCSNRYWSIGSAFYDSDRICKENIKSIEKELQEKLSTDRVVILSWKKLDE
jgi:hypothetical protein